MIADRRWCRIEQDGSDLVPEDDPRAAFLAFIPGQEIPDGFTLLADEPTDEPTDEPEKVDGAPTAKAKPDSAPKKRA